MSSAPKRLTPEVETFCDRRAELGESPLWDSASGRLFWVDINRGRVFCQSIEPGAVARVHAIGQPVGSVFATTAGAMVLAAKSGLLSLDADTGMVADLRPANIGDGIRMNDGNCDSRGRSWVGSMALDERPGAGSLYCIGSDLSMTTKCDRVTISYGIDWSPDGGIMYYVDSATGRIDTFDFDCETGAIGNQQPFAVVSPEEGIPDGLTVDAEGFVWLALWGGWGLHRFDPKGRIDSHLPLPVSHPTSCAFGGPDLRELFVTTATVPLSPSELGRQPSAGMVLKCRPGMQGREPYRFCL
jgi:sugar lactone lactonase YvrE